MTIEPRPLNASGRRLRSALEQRRGEEDVELGGEDSLPLVLVRSGRHSDTKWMRVQVTVGGE
jgi:hypothetical protein